MSGGSSKYSHCSLTRALTFASTSFYALVVVSAVFYGLCVLVLGDDLIVYGYTLFQVSCFERWAHVRSWWSGSDWCLYTIVSRMCSRSYGVYRRHITQEREPWSLVMRHDNGTNCNHHQDSVAKHHINFHSITNIPMMLDSIPCIPVVYRRHVSRLTMMFHVSW